MGQGSLLIIELFGAIAILLWGVRMVRTGIERMFGADLRRILGVAAGNRFSAMFSGAGMAACLQSSTAVIVMAAGFATRGALLPIPGLALVLGADIGTSIAVQVLSFDVKFLSPILLMIGLMVFLSASTKTTRNTGRILLGLGFVLLSLKMIAGATAVFRDSDAVSGVLSVFTDDALLAIAVTAVLTWLAHSSLAIVLLIATLVGAQLVPVELGFNFVLGANLGAAIPAFLMTLSEPVAAQRLTLGNIVFRFCGVVLASLFTPLIAQYALTTEIDNGQLVALFHMGFNLALALFFLPLLGFVSSLLIRLKPSLGDEETDPNFNALYLSDGDKNNPSKALSNVAREALRMADVVYSMLDSSIHAFNDKVLIDKIRQSDDVVDFLHRKSTLYIAGIKREAMNEDDVHRSMEIFALAMNLEHIGDIVDNNLVQLARDLHKGGLSFSQEGQEELQELHRMMVNNFQLSIDLFMSRDEEIAVQLLNEKRIFRDQLFEAAENHMERLRQGVGNSIETSTIHLDILRDFRRINSHIAAVAYPILQNE